MRVFVTKTFRRFQRKECIDGETLFEAIGLAELGSGLIGSAWRAWDKAGEAATAPSSPTAPLRARYSCTGFRKAPKRISAPLTGAT